MNTRVLTYWQPKADLADMSEENQERVKTEFTFLLRVLGYSTVDVESVHPFTSLIQWAEKKTSTWHQDDEPPTDAVFIVWSNLQPTEIIFFGERKIMEIGDGAVILVDNMEVLHRTPLPIHPKRWLIRSEYIVRDGKTER